MASQPLRSDSLQLLAQTPCPIPAGQNGVWIDSGTPNVLKFRLTGGTDTSLGAGGGGSTLATAYSSGAGQSDSTMLLDSTRLGVRIRDAGTPIGSSLFQIQSAGGTTTFFDFSVTGLAMIQTAQTSGAPTQLTVTPNTHTGLTASTNIPDVLFALSRSVQFATGAKTLQTPFRVDPPTYTAVGATTISDAYTAYISGPPAASTNIVQTRSGDLYLGGGQIGSAANFVLMSATADGASSKAVIGNTTTAWSTNGARLHSWQTNSVEKAAIAMYAATGQWVYFIKAGGGFFEDTGNSGFRTTGTSVVDIWTAGLARLNVSSTVCQPSTDFQLTLGGAANRWSQTWSRQYAGVEQTIAAAASITIDPALGQTVRVTLGATAITAVAAGASLLPGQVIFVEIIQDGTGSRSISGWSSAFVFPAGVAPTFTVTANKRDIMMFIVDATAAKLYMAGLQQNL